MAMTRLLISTALAGLLAFGGAASAQPDNNRRQPEQGRAQSPPQAQATPGGGSDRRQGGRAQNTPVAQPAAAPPRDATRGSGENRQGRAMNNAMRGSPSNNGASNNAAAGAMRGPGPGENRQGRAIGNSMRGPSTDAGASNNRAPNNAVRGPAPGNNNANAGRAPNRDFSAYHRNFNAPRRYQAPAYHRPSGWYSRRWTYGQILPAMFWAQNYWLNDYMDFGLPPPPPGTVWVRDGQDALLIDRFSGEIIQVEYSVFY
jgi:Ni/Co efflux regulator RcnB